GCATARSAVGGSAGQGAEVLDAGVLRVPVLFHRFGTPSFLRGQAQGRARVFLPRLHRCAVLCGEYANERPSGSDSPRLSTNTPHTSWTRGWGSTQRQNRHREWSPMSTDVLVYWFRNDLRL